MRKRGGVTGCTKKRGGDTIAKLNKKGIISMPHKLKKNDEQKFKKTDM